MRKIFAILALLASATVAANTLVLLQPPKSPFPLVFGHSVGCYVTGAAADDNFAGVCRYAGYKGATASGIVEWTADGTPSFVQPCHVIGQQVNAGYPTCPANVLGPLTTFSDEDSYYEVFVKVIIGDVSGGILDEYPRVPVLVLP